MNWIKKGVVYRPEGGLWWSKQRAYLPTAVKSKDFIRIYFASMDEEMIGRVGFIDVDKYNPKNILNISKEPVLDIGNPGCFDESGVTPSQIFSIEKIIDGKPVFMNYYGWMKTTKSPQILFSGQAISFDGGDTFIKTGSIPSLLDRTFSEYIARSCPFMQYIGNELYIYYTGNLSGFDVDFNGVKSPRYTIKVCNYNNRNVSLDCLGLRNDEFGLSRPWVIRESGIYKMFYSRRSLGKSYRLGYAESEDGLIWNRKDEELNLDVSPGEFDSDMMCFSSIVDIEDKRYMFYNGNNHGASGIGYAELQL